MKIFIQHVTTYEYAEAPKRIALLLKLMPGAFASQRPIEWQVSVNGEAITGFKPNAFSDMDSLWVSNERLETVTVIAGGAIDTIDTSGILRGLDERLDPRVFLRETPLTEASKEICDLADSIETGDTLDWLHQLMAALHERIDYRKGATSSETTAAQAFTIGAGVCQDHAQIFIAAARHKGIPARYVSGYLLAGPDEELHEMHGWAEVLVPGLGWIGFDPSNKLCVTDNYIRLASGLDAFEAAPIRGSVIGHTEIEIAADVRISENMIDTQAQQSQMQQQSRG